MANYLIILLTILSFSAKAGYYPIPLPGTSGNVLTSNGTKWVSQASSASQYVIQQVRSSSVSYASGTTLFPLDDTIPQNTEGDEYLTVTITPTSATSKLVIEANMIMAHSVVTIIIAALFQDSTANAISASWNLAPTANNPETIPLRYYMTSGTTSATTFKIRCGATNAGVTQMNGASGARYLGGALFSSLTVTEYSN